MFDAFDEMEKRSICWMDFEPISEKKEFEENLPTNTHIRKTE